MTTATTAEVTTGPAPQRFGRAYGAAVVTVLYLKGVEAVCAPEGLAAAVWFKPLTLAVVTLLTALVLAPVALWNTAVFVHRFPQMQAARWRAVATWALWLGYGVPLLAATYYLTASRGRPGVALGCSACWR